MFDQLAKAHATAEPTSSRHGAHFSSASALTAMLISRSSGATVLMLMACLALLPLHLIAIRAQCCSGVAHSKT